MNLQPTSTDRFDSDKNFCIDYRYVADDYALPISTGIHSHAVGELMVVKSGSSSICIGDTIGYADGSYIVYFAKEIPHCSVTLPRHEYSRYCLKIDESYFSSKVAIPNDSFIIPVTPEELDALLAPTELLFKYFGYNIESYTEIMLKRREHLLRLLLDEIDSLSQSRKNLDAISRKSYITKVCEYLTIHFRESISLDALANEFYISKAKLTRDFRDKCGVSIGDFIVTLRIRYAKKLLENSSVPIGQIAKECGYQSNAYFARQFLKMIGITPTQYRKMILNK